MVEVSEIERELEIAQSTLQELAGEDVDAIEIKSVEADEALERPKN